MQGLAFDCLGTSHVSKFQGDACDCPDPELPGLQSDDAVVGYTFCGSENSVALIPADSGFFDSFLLFNIFNLS
jgi:hypothetical protein